MRLGTLTPPPIIPTRMVFTLPSRSSDVVQRMYCASVRDEHLCVDCTALTLSTASVVSLPVAPKRS